MNLYNLVFKKNKYIGDFGCNKNHKEEVNKWLINATEVNPDFIKNNSKRFIKEKQRDEALSELLALYIVRKVWNMDIITFETSSPIDFVYKDSKGVLWNAEVTATSWRKDIAEEFKSNKLSRDQLQIRKAQPKEINGEARSVGFEGIDESISHGLKKFQKNNHNILFVHLDTFGDLFRLGDIEKWCTFKKIAIETDKNHIINTYILFALKITESNTIEYIIKKISI